MRGRLVLSGLVIAAAACRAAAPTETPRPAIQWEAMPDAPAPETIAWSPDRPLRWTDFRAQPAFGTGAAALTITTLTMQFACSGEMFGADITAVFFPNRSWVNQPLFVELGSDRWGLRHEQTHFDLTELHARRARQYFATLAQPCARSGQELSGLGTRLVDETMDAQARYDRETIHGRDGGAQSRWDSEVTRQLAELSTFERR